MIQRFPVSIKNASVTKNRFGFAETNSTPRKGWLKMKKCFAVILVLLMSVGILGLTASAEANDPVTVCVTIADGEGNLVLAQEEVTVSDADADGALTINDALYAAHEANYEGGAAAGYAFSVGSYGLSLDKLWGGANGGSYGYYLNNASAWSLGDAVKDGDHVNAFVYTDLTAWSDTYCYFDVHTVEGKVGEEITLTLSAAGYDAEYNPVVLPVENAVITVNGEKTSYKTDKDGKAAITIAAEGVYVISAVSDTQTLVPPACKAAVAAAEAPVATTTSSVPETTVPTTTQKAVAAGDDGNHVVLVVLAAIAVLAGVVLSVKRHSSYEK